MDTLSGQGAVSEVVWAQSHGANDYERVQYRVGFRSPIILYESTQFSRLVKEAASVLCSRERDGGIKTKYPKVR